MTKEFAIQYIQEECEDCPEYKNGECISNSHCFEVKRMAIQVIKALEQEPCDKYIKEIDHLHKYISKLETQIVMQEPCEDCISRQAVLDLVNSDWKYEGLETYVVSLPSVNPQKIGHWIDTGSGQECSECREIQCGYDSFRHFCANCGAKMIEPMESEDAE